MDNYWEKFDKFQSTEAEILANKRNGRIYVADFARNEGKYISVLFEDKGYPYDINIKISPRIELRITYITKKDKIDGVQISKLDRGKTIEKINLSTLGLEGILALLHVFSNLDIQAIANKSILLDAKVVKDKDKLRTHLMTILADDEGFEVLEELAIAKGFISRRDIGDLSKKRKALSLFYNLLNDKEFFGDKKIEWSKKRDEDVWQKFFEDNKWIFGYGLEYIFNAPIDEEKLQQTLVGSNFLSSGKRPDGILKSLGLIQFLNIVEIKTDTTNLMNNTQYRTSGIWQVSNELIGAVSQCQQYIRASIKNLTEYFNLMDEEGNRLNEEVFCFSPKCFLVIGDLKKDFLNEQEKVINPNKLACFEYFRKNLISPEIITFDQLYLRAKNIIHNYDE